MKFGFPVRLKMVEYCTNMIIFAGVAGGFGHGAVGQKFTLPEVFGLVEKTLKSFPLTSFEIKNTTFLHLFQL